MQRPSEVLGLTPDVVSLSTAFLGTRFFGERGPNRLGEDLMGALETAWVAGRVTGTPLKLVVDQASALAMRARGTREVPGARVQARPAREVI